MATHDLSVLGDDRLVVLLDRAEAVAVGLEPFRWREVDAAYKYGEAVALVGRLGAELARRASIEADEVARLIGPVDG